MLKGISLGIGITFGVIIAIILITAVILLIVGLYKLHMRSKFSRRLFHKYKQNLIKDEKFEELNTVNEIILKLKKNENPKELLKEYTVNVDTYLYWQAYEEGDRLVLRQDKKISKKKKFKPSKPKKKQ